MSWGYFLDMELDLPSAAWERLKTATAGAHEVPPTWWQLQDLELAQSFSTAGEDADVTFEDAVARYTRDGAIGTVETEGDITSIHVSTLLDKSLLSEAKPFSALLEAARTAGGSGALRLVNDGTYEGEGGVVITLADGALAHEAIDDPWPWVEKLGTELFGGT